MMVLRLLALVLVFAAASWATPAAHAQSNGSTDDGSAQVEPEEPEPIPDFWTVEEPASGSSTKEPDAPASSPSDQTSTSPGGPEPASGTTTTGPGGSASTPVAPAQAGTETVQDDEPSCDPRLALRRALRSLRSALRGRNLLDPRARAVAVRVSPCVPGTFELAVVLEGAETVLWRARRDLATTQRATLRLKLTGAGRRFIARASRGPSRTVRMRLRARLTP